MNFKPLAKGGVVKEGYPLSIIWNAQGRRAWFVTSIHPIIPVSIL